MTSNGDLRAMGTFTLTLHKTKDTKNKVVYRTDDGSVIQSLYIDKDALGEALSAAMDGNSTPTRRSWWSFGRGRNRTEEVITGAEAGNPGAQQAS